MSLLKSANHLLILARHVKNDEFYTLMVDIEDELIHYKEHFKDKIIYLNCDDPHHSNFFRFFVSHFNEYGIKKLIATCYWTENSWLSEKPWKAEITEVNNESDIDSLVKNPNNKLSVLQGDGDFRSQECQEILRESDIAITNPPFSLFREWVELMIREEKKFLVIGNHNAISCNNMFKLVKNKQMWYGYCTKQRNHEFLVPKDYPLRTTSYREDVNGNKYVHITNIRWFTNLDLGNFRRGITLTKQYNNYDYPKYDNYDAIEVNRTKNIPYDYDGVMGVPVTFLTEYNPDQFEIVGIGKRNQCPELRTKIYQKEDGDNFQNWNAGPTLKLNNKIQNTYVRIFIRNKHPQIKRKHLKTASLSIDSH